MGSTSGDQKQTVGEELAFVQDTPFSVRIIPITQKGLGTSLKLRPRVGEL